MPLLGTRGVASARGFGFGGQVNPFWLGAGSTGAIPSSTIADGQGNIYVLTSQVWDGTYNYTDLVVYKYTAAGSFVWGRTYRSGLRLTPRSIILDNFANPSFIYFTGDGSGGGSFNATVFKASAVDGVAAWARYFSGSNSWAVTGLALSGSNLYITGIHFSVSFVIRYNTDGVMQNFQHYTINNRNQTVFVSGCAAAPNGDLYLFGSHGNNLTVYWARVTSALGSLTWQVSGGINLQAAINALVSDANGDFYWAGPYLGSGGNRLFRAGKRNSSGAEIWTRNMDPSDFGGFTISGQMYPLTLSSTGELYFCGKTNYGRSSGGQQPTFTVKLNSDGSFGFANQLIAKSISQGNTFETSSSTATPSSTGYIFTASKPFNNTPGFQAFFNLPANGSKTGTYDYPDTDRRYEYTSASISVYSVSPSSSNPGISTFSHSLSFSGAGVTSSATTVQLNPIPI